MNKIIIAILCIAILFILVANNIITVPCAFHEITGLYCPGCGVTRMFLSIAELNFYQAFRYNPFVFVLLIIYLNYKLYYLIIWLFDRNKKQKKIPELIIYIILIVAILFGILRNIEIFNWLAPTKL